MGIKEYLYAEYLILLRFHQENSGWMLADHREVGQAGNCDTLTPNYLHTLGLHLYQHL